MNTGFFSTSQIKSYVKAKNLPPILKIKLPEIETKPKKKPNLVFDPPIQLMDIECYINYFLIKFLRVEDNEITPFEQLKGEKLNTKFIRAILNKYEIITFNGNNYDILILRLAMEGASCKELKEASDLIIQHKMRPWDFERHYNLPDFKINHIDLKELAPGRVSLKIYGGRLNCDIMMGLPYPEHTVLTESQMDDVFDYCDYDLDDTLLLFTELLPQIEIRREMSKKFKLDLRSKSDAQIAEAVIKSEIEKVQKKKLEKGSFDEDMFFFDAPSFIKFSNPKLNEILDIVTTKPFTIGRDGKPVAPKELTGFKVKIGSSIYSMGKGGLHSTEKTIYHVTDDKYSLWDWDAGSYYPVTILRNDLYPKQLGKPFLTVYRPMVIERLEAKNIKDKTEQLKTLIKVYKIILNGSYGKFGQPGSILYAPDLMIQVTLTGQLSILMLVDILEQFGIPVVSGNTDGILVKCPNNRIDVMNSIIKRWEKQTGFEMESTKYVGVYSRDVNNYMAIQENGEVKRRGCFKARALDKNPANEICSIAMINYIKYGTPFEETISNCTDISKFVTVNKVEGGAIKNGKYLGEAIRFYHAQNETGFIEYKSNGNKVALTEGTKPIMDLTIPFPKDIDYNWYINTTGELF